MSHYGVDYYGLAYYGPRTDVSYDASPVIATPYDYNKISISWSMPSGNWDLLRLVRNPYGFPLTPDDGDLLFEETNLNTLNFYTDTGSVPVNTGLKPGHPYYYTVFVRQTVAQTWVQAGNAIGISVKDFNTVNHMFNGLPKVLTSQVPADSSLDQNNDQFRQFLKIFAFTHDHLKSSAENLVNRYDVQNVNGRLIPIMLQEFGSVYEPEIGLRQARIFLRNLTRLYQTKGSKAGLENYIKAFIGYDNAITLGKNLMLDYNDSSFEECIGTWGSVANANLEWHSSTATPIITPYAEPTAALLFPNKQLGTLKVTSITSATTEIALVGDQVNYPDSTPRNWGVPVAPATSYVLSGYSKAGSVSRSVSALISWYKADGTFISTTTAGTGVANATATWSRCFVTATSPSNAYYAVPHFKVTSTAAAEVHYFDAVQFEFGSTPTTFEEARKILINLKASRINELLNPNFEDTTDHWSVSNGHFILTTSEELLPTPEDPHVSISGGAVEVYADVAGIVKVSSDVTTISPNNSYTFSIYCGREVEEFDTAGPEIVTPFISWYDSSNTLIGTTEGDAVETVEGYTRAHVTSSSPANSVKASVGIKWDASGPMSEVLLDAALFEKSAVLSIFFDGNHGFSEQSDVLWEGGNLPGTINNARSHYYKNRYSSEQRLLKTITDWITLGSVFELYFAKP